MRLAVVTGGARRIGAAITNHLLDEGWAVIITCNQSLTQATQLLSRGEGAVVRGDLTNDEDLFKLIEEIHDHDLVSKAGGIDLLIHNASIFDEADFSTITPQELRRYSGVHLDAPFFITQGLAPKLKQKKGCVVGIVDTSWNHAWEKLSHYTSTKAALRQLIVNLAGELAPEIRVNGVAPGAIIAAAWEQEKFEKVLEKVPLGRSGTPQDIANAIMFLYEAEYITGHILPVDGGWSIS